MNVPVWLWAVTVVGLIAVICLDFYLISRNPRDPSLRECTAWIGVYVALAVAFGFVIVATQGGQYGGEFFAGWITEYSLSVDNLFVFVIIMSSFAVPREYRQKVLSIGIVIALVMRGAFIMVGYEAISRFDWLFYVFGAFLVYTAWKLVAHKPYLVFTANAFALMGLRQLFFLIGGLLDRLVYLSVGLAVVLGFIGLKLVLEALHHDGVAWAPEIPILVSLAVIVGTLALTTVASLWKVRRDARLTV